MVNQQRRLAGGCLWKWAFILAALLLTGALLAGCVWVTLTALRLI